MTTLQIYVDDNDATLNTQINTKVIKNGDTMCGDLDMGIDTIIYITTPSSINDATNNCMYIKILSHLIPKLIQKCSRVVMQ